MSILGATPFDGIFAELTKRLGVLVSAETSPSMRSRVEMTEGDATPEAAPYRRAGEKTIARYACAWTATCHAPTSIETMALASELHGHLDEIVGPPQGCAVAGHDGYKVTKIGPALGADGSAAGCSRKVDIILYRPVASQIRRTAKISTTTITATAEATADATEASLSAST